MLNVLIVEDDPMVAAINKKYLEQTDGFALAGIVPTAKEALAALQAQTQPISLLLLDVFMPGMDGLTLLKTIRSNHPGIDVIMVTAARSSKDIQNALRLGVIDYIVKPFTFERFQASLMAYQERVRLLGSEEELSQDVLDKRIFTQKTETVTLPKGIDPHTLKLVRLAATNYGNEFTTNDLVSLVGISRISLKKYLDYLEQISCLVGTLAYIPIGRPVKTYRWVGDKGCCLDVD
jgi:Response regulator of citrate/malate metabolism